MSRDPIEHAFDDVIGLLERFEPTPCSDDLADRVSRLETSPALAVRVSLRCTFCHDALDHKGAVFCAACIAPHHADCFREHGSCCAPGCVETEVLQRAPRRRRVAWPLVGMLVMAGGVAAWSVAENTASQTTHEAPAPAIEERVNPEDPWGKGFKIPDDALLGPCRVCALPRRNDAQGACSECGFIRRGITPVYVADLTHDYERLLAAEPKDIRATLRGLEGELQEELGEFDAKDTAALLTLRRLRCKASIPLLLRAIAIRQLERERFVARALETLSILTGVLPWRSPNKLRELAVVWWGKNRDSLELDLALMPERSLRGVAHTLMNVAARSEPTWPPLKGEVFTHWRNAKHARGVEWLARYRSAGTTGFIVPDWDPRLVPLVLSMADSGDRIWSATRLLRVMQAHQQATGLRQLARDPKRPPRERLVATLALWKVGEPLDDALPREVILSESTSIGVKHDAALLLAHSDGVDAVHVLSRHLRPGDPLEQAAAYALGSIKTREAQAALAKGIEHSLGEAVRTGRREHELIRNLRTLLRGFSRATGESFGQRQYFSMTYCADEARRALRWWEQQGGSGD